MHQYRVLGMTILALGILAGVAQAQQPAGPPGPPGTEVLARGPIHEAFAEPISAQPTQGTVVPTPPPAPIDELPPEEKPAGTNVQWLPGYWAWDLGSNNFVWVSGCWRDVPPGRRWLPGHWQQLEQGYVWISGFWGPDNLQQVQYLPPPPPTVETGPSSPAPNAGSFYVGGYWFYTGGGYRWVPGHWVAYQPGWVWVPAHYVWTPVGCLFVAGYWDHPLEMRGLLFAPVQFDLAVCRAARRPFIPQFCIPTDFLLGALFVGPHTRHYYFGDFFEPRFGKLGFVAWTDHRPRPGMFDPNFAYYRHLHAADPGWVTSLQKLYAGRRAGTIARPPHTLVEQARELKKLTTERTAAALVHNAINLSRAQNVTALAPLKEMHNLKVTALAGLTPGHESKVAAHTLKLEAVQQVDHQREQKAAAQLREFAVQHRETEAKLLHAGTIPVKHTDAPHTVKLALPTPPVHAVAPRPAARVVPAAPRIPAHVAHAIPKYEPRPAARPPKKR